MADSRIGLATFILGHDARSYEAIHDRTFEIEFVDAGVQAYVFTFG